MTYIRQRNCINDSWRSDIGCLYPLMELKPLYASRFVDVSTGQITVEGMLLRREILSMKRMVEATIDFLEVEQTVDELIIW